MLPKRVIHATNVSKFSGVGHFRRLVEIARALPASVEKAFFGPVKISWARELYEETFVKVDFRTKHEGYDLVILDSYDEIFCKQVESQFSNSTVLQIADRYTPLLPNSLVLFMDLPFPYADSSIESRVIGHGIEYLPIRDLSKLNTLFPDQAQRVLVTTGGLINEAIFGQLFAELNKKEYRDITFEIIGRYRNLTRNANNFHFYDFGSGFDAIAKNCDTAISAAGTTLWDLLASHKLVGLAAIVKNQRANFEYVIENRQAIELFGADELDLNTGALQTLLFDTKVRRSIRQETFSKYDFGGAKRVCNLILEIL
jgi:spore coat polysaccharide biosynthesis predicted glycosyltransferase SpsG